MDPLGAVWLCAVSQSLSCIPRALRAVSKSFVSQSLSLSRARSELRDWLTRPLLGSPRRGSMATLYATLILCEISKIIERLLQCVCVGKAGGQ